MPIPDLLRTVFTLVQRLVKMSYHPRPSADVWEEVAELLHELMVTGEMGSTGGGIRFMHHTAVHWHLAHTPAVIRDCGRVLVGEATEHSHQFDSISYVKRCRPTRSKKCEDMVRLALLRRHLAANYGYTSKVKEVTSRRAYH